jgi:Ni,Fe-hydrogenase I large subunit
MNLGLRQPVWARKLNPGISWLKAPLYRNLPCEAGPLARMWVNGD